MIHNNNNNNNNYDASTTSSRDGTSNVGVDRTLTDNCMY